MALGRHFRVPCVATIRFHSKHELPGVAPFGWKPLSSPSIRNRSESRKKNPCRLRVMLRGILVNFTGEVPGGCRPTGKNTHQRRSKEPCFSFVSIESAVIIVAK